MNYMKGYNNRERRRRRRSHFSKGSDNYIGNSSYSSRSKYRSSMGQAVSGRWIVCLIAVIVLIAVGAVCLVQAEFGNDEQPKGQAVASGSGVTATQTAQATAAVTTAVNSASAASQQTKVPEKGQATYAPDGIAKEIAAVPTLAPQTIPTPVPKIRSKAVALSFDDGPSTVNTPKVLALLKQYQAHATFFVVGTRVKADEFYILTDVPYIYKDYKKPTEKKLEFLDYADTMKYLEDGTFAEGSMAPKIRACLLFVKDGGQKSVITEATKLEDRRYGSKITMEYEDDKR